MNLFTFRKFIAILWLSPFFILAQEIKQPELKAEKIYLQLSATTVAVDQLIWFKAIVTDWENHLASGLSQVLYVELIDNKEQIVKRKAVKLNGGIGQGHLEMKQNINPGRYLLRAYTQWNQNFGAEFMYTTYINLYNGQGQMADPLNYNPNATAVNSDTDEPVLNTAIKVNFFPESGKLVHGINNKIGFKAVGADGNGIACTGILYDHLGAKLATFKSNPLGMGYFFIQADSTRRFWANISPNSKGIEPIKVDLPEVAPKGSVLRVQSAGEKIRIHVLSNALSGNVFIKVSSRGEDRFLIEGQLENGQLLTSLEAANFPEGILVFTLLDSRKLPMAERLFFNSTKSSRFQIQLSPDKRQYKKRELLNLKLLNLTNTDSIVAANVSVMAINKEQWAATGEADILSYFLLDSEIKGRVEQAGYYFNADTGIRNQDLDALMLTQGWRNYLYPKSQSAAPLFWPEKGLTIKGKVVSATSKRTPVSDLELSLGVFAEDSFYYKKQTDSLGKFQFVLDDIYGSKPRILLQGNGERNKTKNVNIEIDVPIIPEIHYQGQYNSKRRERPEVVKTIVAAQQRRRNFSGVADSLLGVTQLDEVIVEDFGLTPLRERAYKDFGRPDVIIRGDSLQKQEQSWSYGLYSILLFKYPDLVQIERFSDGFMLAHVNNTPTLVAVDGRILRSYEYDFVQHISPARIESVEIMQFAPFFKRKFLSAFPGADPFHAPTVGHIIAIFTKNKVGLGITGKPIRGMLSTTVQGFAPIKEFYAPVHEASELESPENTDQRSLLFWAPSLLTDSNGEVAASFYNCDVPGEYIIIVEGITEDGKIGYNKIEYTVLD